MAPHWRDRIAPGPAPLAWTKQRNGSWTALDRFQVTRISGDLWALEDSNRGPRLEDRTVGTYAALPLAQGVAAYMVANETGTPTKER